LNYFSSKKEMTSKIERRSFLTRLGLGLGGTLLFPFTQWGKSKTTEMPALILKTRPLGFQWETLDPFLFCVHHEDFFPKGNAALGPDPKNFEGATWAKISLSKTVFACTMALPFLAFLGTHTAVLKPSQSSEQVWLTTQIAWALPAATETAMSNG